MKNNVIFAWPVLTTIFTVFLFWSGYWYNLGYAEFYQYNINVFDISIPQTIIEGLVYNSIEIIYLIFTLVSISFVNSMNKEQWEYGALLFVSLLISIITFIYYFLKPLLRFISYFVFYLLDFLLAPVFLVFNFLNLIFLIIVSGKLLVFLIHLNNIYYDFLKHLGRVFFQTNEVLVKNELTESDISRQLFKTASPKNSFLYSVCFHYIGLLALVVFLVLLFNSAQSLAVTGKKDAKNKFENFNSMEWVQVKGSLGEELRNTDICFKGFCLITDNKKNVQIYEMKDVKVINNFNKCSFSNPAILSFSFCHIVDFNTVNEKMNRVYKEVSESSTNIKQLNQSQSTWVKQLKTTCEAQSKVKIYFAEIQCKIDMTQERINYLKKIGNGDLEKLNNEKK